MRVADIMTRTVVSLSPDHGIRHAAEVMHGHAVSGLPVIDNDQRLVGMLTEGDLIDRIEIGQPGFAVPGRDSHEAYVRSHAWRVGDVMSTDLATIEATAPIGEAAEIMRRRNVKRLPVMADGRLVGIVSRADLIGAYLAMRPDSLAKGDEAMARAIKARLVHDLGMAPDAIEVTVRDGAVTLSGRVGSERERQAACLAADSVPGVAGVTATIRVEPVC